MIANNIDHKQYYKRCEKNVFLSSFIVNRKSYQTCNTCRIQNSSSMKNSSKIASKKIK